MGSLEKEQIYKKKVLYCYMLELIAGQAWVNRENAHLQVHLKNFFFFRMKHALFIFLANISFSA